MSYHVGFFMRFDDPAVQQPVRWLIGQHEKAVYHLPRYFAIENARYLKRQKPKLLSMIRPKLP